MLFPWMNIAVISSKIRLASLPGGRTYEEGEDQLRVFLGIKFCTRNTINYANRLVCRRHTLSQHAAAKVQ